MSKAGFTIEVPAKWVLAGEHSVLKGKPALTMPYQGFSLKLKWVPRNIENKNLEENEFQCFPMEKNSFIQEVLEKLKKIIPQDYQNDDCVGTLILENTIPLQAGLGSSAALSVGLVQFLTRGKVKNEEELQKLKWAMELENHFHGKSSGMDVAAVFMNAPLKFTQGQGFQKLDFKELPSFTFHNTFEVAATQKCVEQVFEFEKKDPNHANNLHLKMGDATFKAEQGLFLFQEGKKEEAQLLIAQAMDQSLECFYEWGLVTSGIHQKILELKKLQPLAVKLTGAGLGGFLVALWR